MCYLIFICICVFPHYNCTIPLLWDPEFSIKIHLKTKFHVYISIGILLVYLFLYFLFYFILYLYFLPIWRVAGSAMDPKTGQDRDRWVKL
jgi:hypothetical protein